MVHTILKILTITLLFSIFSPLSAQEIWEEHFDIPEKGIWGTETENIESDFTGITKWNLIYSDINLKDSNDYAKTVPTSGGRFEARDIDGEVTWISEWIDISNYDKIKIRLNANETGSGKNVKNKYIKAYYKIDKNNETLFQQNGINQGNWGKSIVEQKGITGNSLQIICYICNHYASDKVILDNIIIEEDYGILPPTNAYDVVINELMVDPNPPVGLPKVEYIELYNTREHPVNTKNWSIKINGISKPIKQKTIKPDEYLLLCSTGSLKELLPYGNAINIVGFQGLLNKGAAIEIINDKGIIIDHINYSENWYKDDNKERGGWSLERIDPYRWCNQPDNWQASHSKYGGTPGGKNSIFSDNPDDIPPYINWAVATNRDKIEISFSEPIDTNSINEYTNFTLSGKGHPINIVKITPETYHLYYRNSPLTLNKIYNLTLNNIYDECGNILNDIHRKVQYVKICPGDILINEILFNPISDDNDYIEIYNNSNKLIPLNNIQLANRDNSNNIKQSYPLTTDKKIISPGEYLVLTTDTNSIFSWYSIKCKSCFLQMNKIPSLPNKEGNIVLLANDNKAIDEFSYSEDMHSSFLADFKGVSLERISFSVNTNNVNNWQSASSDVGYGTPGYKNSQTENNENNHPQFNFSTKTFSPNYDGYNDELQINYNLNKSGYICNIKIFDANGHFVMDLLKNEILGTNGTIRWNGKDNTGRKQPLGAYILIVEIFNKEGDNYLFKQGVVLTDIL